MFFYQFSNLDDFIKSDLNSHICEEKQSLQELKNLFNIKKENLLNITNNIVLLTNKLDEENNTSRLDDFYNTIATLKNSFKKIEILSISLEQLYSLLDTIESLRSSPDLNSDEIKAILIEFNKKKDGLLRDTFILEKDVSSVLNTAIALSVLNINTSSDINADIDTVTKMTNCHFLNDNNTLVISEKDQKAYLPYLQRDIEKIYKNANGKYATIKDVIKDLYVIPLKNYKNSSLSRFREAYNLMKEKEHSSTIKALDLGLELMFKSRLNPIIISACKNLEELDIYLDCLESNELFDFKCFEIKFEISPK